MNDLTDQNPRAVIGANDPPLWATLRALADEPDFASTVADNLTDQYGEVGKEVAALLDEARTFPRAIEDAETKAKVASVIKRLRDAKKKLDAYHEREKTPYLRGGQAVDQFFFGLIDKCVRRSKSNNKGAADILNDRLTDYDNRLLAEEQERRRAEADRLAREHAAAEQKRIADEKAAEEARLAAERARKPETQEAKAAVADAQEQQAAAARVEATVAAARAEEAHVATLAKPADIMRTRTDDGTLSTVGQEKYAEIVDRDLLDKEKLWAYLGIDALQKALNGWARATDYRQQMPGAAIGRRNRSVVR